MHAVKPEPVWTLTERVPETGERTTQVPIGNARVRLVVTRVAKNLGHADELLMEAYVAQAPIELPATTIKHAGCLIPPPKS